MKPITDQTIELLVRCPSSLPPDVRQMVEEYAAKDPFGRAVAQFYREFYEELDALESGSLVWLDDRDGDLDVRVGMKDGGQELRRAEGQI